MQCVSVLVAAIISVLACVELGFKIATEGRCDACRSDVWFLEVSGSCQLFAGFTGSDC